MCVLVSEAKEDSERLEEKMEGEMGVGDGEGRRGVDTCK